MAQNDAETGKNQAAQKIATMALTVDFELKAHHRLCMDADLYSINQLL
jgi:hypothetical protein